MATGNPSEISKIEALTGTTLKPMYVVSTLIFRCFKFDGVLNLLQFLQYREFLHPDKLLLEGQHNPL